MFCPYCHNENKIDALTCDFCMRELPLDAKRCEEIKRINKINSKNKWQNTITKLIGLISGVIIIIAIIIIAWLNTRG